MLGREGSPASSGNGSGLRGLGEFRGVLPDGWELWGGGRGSDVVGEQCTRTAEMPGTHEEVGAVSVLWGRTRCSHSEDGANRDSAGRRDLRGGRMCVYGRG